jgi:hypothetical protein
VLQFDFFLTKRNSCPQRVLFYRMSLPKRCLWQNSSAPKAHAPLAQTLPSSTLSLTGLLTMTLLSNYNLTVPCRRQQKTATHADILPTTYYSQFTIHSFPLVRSFSKQHHRHSLKQNLKIEQQRLILHVVQIQQHHILKTNMTAP